MLPLKVDPPSPLKPFPKRTNIPLVVGIQDLGGLVNAAPYAMPGQVGDHPKIVASCVLGDRLANNVRRHASPSRHHRLPLRLPRDLKQLLQTPRHHAHRGARSGVRPVAVQLGRHVYVN